MDTVIGRDLRAAAVGSYDLLVVGGGIYGVTLALEAARRGLSALLVERSDFGGATTWNSLRIVHGGLRYLQTMDLTRHRESVRERQWFLRHFPDLVEPLPCLMPLHDPPRGGRLRRPGILRAALAADALLARDRALPRGHLLGPAETAELFPAVDRAGLRGGALWHDAFVADSHRLVIELLRWACRCGARALNYVEAVELRVEDGKVRGLRAVDRESGRSFELEGRAVVNCAGPWVGRTARRFDRDRPGLFQPVLAFNLLLDREPPSSVAVAVASREPGAQTWFLVPWKGRLLAGTAYAPATEEALRDGMPGAPQIEGFLRELNAAMPGLDAAGDQVLRVLWGRLPAAAAGSTVPASRPVIQDHGSDGGPRGLVSVSGVKLTTARTVAGKVLAVLEAGGALKPAARPAEVERPAADPPLSLEELTRLAGEDWGAARDHLRGLVERQSVVRLEDLLLRRTDWGIDPERGEAAARLCESLGWQGFRPLRAAGGRGAG
ncbi:MAG TPA: FAD-dependent oxidoreductase [Thermoanaerobaculia bacterium]|nr:FAD-dependent oxidoreductase [Thermoanaerobaculia bacterium]